MYCMNFQTNTDHICNLEAMHFIDMSYPDDLAQTPDRQWCVWMDGWMMDGWTDR
jgi:hypothetical protein